MTSDRDSSNDVGDESGDRDTAATQELEARIDALESSLRKLRRESMRPPRGPLGLPRPPSPREFVEFTDRHAIPATIAFLEAHIRALQALQAALRLVRGADETRERTASARARTEELGRRTLDALDTALDDVADVIEEGRLPENAEARSVLIEARQLTDEIRQELDAAVPESGTQTPDARSTSGEQRESDRGTAPRDLRVDPEEVETELDVLRDEFDADEPDDETDDEGDADGVPDSE